MYLFSSSGFSDELLIKEFPVAYEDVQDRTAVVYEIPNDLPKEYISRFISPEQGGTYTVKFYTFTNLTEAISFSVVFGAELSKVKEPWIEIKIGGADI
jgi:hypothetical protein